MVHQIVAVVPIHESPNSHTLRILIVLLSRFRKDLRQLIKIDIFNSKIQLLDAVALSWLNAAN